MSPHEPEHISPTSFGTYLRVWFALLVLLALTVTAASFSWGGKSIFVALLIAAVKTILVLSFFMHLRHERPFFRGLFLIVVLALTVFIGLTFTDVAFRY